ncbi:MAG: hypothetical protein O2779_03055 [Nanoarchaeota archaeon]|nr:hypothetical protein [Nanoarchaeota archaeon]
MKTELFVRLKVVDTTALTALTAIQEMGFKEVIGVKRDVYYAFESDSDISKEIVGVDVLVNANKHAARLSSDVDGVGILVTDVEDDCSSLLHTLTERLGISSISHVTRGVFWMLQFKGGVDRDFAEKIASGLLCNEHYQKYEILG